MLTHPTRDKLAELRLHGMLTALDEQRNHREIDQLGFEERLGLLVDREMTERQNRRLKLRLQKARLRQNAIIEDIDFRTPRGLDRGFILDLAGGQWIHDHRNIIITGPTGVGKTYLACALAQKGCRHGHSALYTRLSRMLQELGVAKGIGTYAKSLLQLARFDVLVLDDWGMAPLSDENRRDLLEVIEDRYDTRSTIIATQFPVDTWHEIIGEHTLADAILDRLVHNAHIISLKGESMRKKKTGKTKTPTKNKKNAA